MLRKRNPWRCQRYLDWVKTQPSAISGRPADDPHHMKGHGMGGTVPAPDWATIPLTRQEHDELHNHGWQTWEMKHGNQWEYVGRTLGKAIQEGVLELEIIR